jgi:phosphate transport system permease protein
MGMSDINRAAGTEARQTGWLVRLVHAGADRSEPIVEWVIRLCGWSAIGFVFAIFFFVFREAAPALFGGLNLAEFFTSPKWQPTSEVQPHFGALALIVGTLSVTGLAL